jgi:tetratricopeptide (TPR) repeat protein
MSSALRWSSVRGAPRAALLAGALIVLGLANSRQQPSLDASFLRTRGEARLRAGDAAAAGADFERAARLDPRDYIAYNGLARSLETQRQGAKALATHDSVLARVGRLDLRLVERQNELSNAALAYYRQGRLEDARPALETLHAEGAGTLQTDVLLSLGAPFARAEILQHEMQQRYGDVEVVWKCALVLGARRSTPVAPSSAALFCGLRQPRPSPEQVRSDVQAALARGESRDLSFANLGETELGVGQRDSAAAAFSRIGPGPMAGYRELLLGQVDLSRRDGVAALRHFRAADSCGGVRVPRETLHYQRASAFYLMGEPDSVSAEVARALQANPLGARDDFLLGQSEAARGRAADSKAAYARVLEVDPQHAEAAFQLGVLLVKDGRRDQAEAWLQRALRLQPTGPHAEEARRLLAAR